MPIELAVILRSKLHLVVVDRRSVSARLFADREENEREMALVVYPWGRLDDARCAQHLDAHWRHPGQATALGGLVVLVRASGSFSVAPLLEGSSDLQAPETTV